MILNRESGNRYHITNSWGYMGRYQFGKSTLKGLDLMLVEQNSLTIHNYKKEKNEKLLEHNKEKLQKYIDIFDGKQSMECIFQKVVYWRHILEDKVQ